MTKKEVTMHLPTKHNKNMLEPKKVRGVSIPLVLTEEFSKPSERIVTFRYEVV